MPFWSQTKTTLEVTSDCVALEPGLDFLASALDILWLGLFVQVMRLRRLRYILKPWSSSAEIAGGRSLQINLRHCLSTFSRGSWRGRSLQITHWLVVSKDDSILSQWLLQLPPVCGKLYDDSFQAEQVQHVLLEPTNTLVYTGGVNPNPPFLLSLCAPAARK